jgi:hypothetical protein
MESTSPKLGALRASGHLCFPYEGDDEKAATLVAFVRDGLARRERCLFIGSADDQHALVDRLEQAGVPTGPPLEGGALILATQGETYLRGGRFDVEETLALMEGLTDRALADGFVGLRATGEASGPVPDELWREVMRYEALLNERLGRRPFLALCRLHAAHVAPDRVRDVLRTHPHAVVRGDVCRNPFYERSELALSGDSRARLDWQLHQLRAYHRARQDVDDGAAGRARERLLAVLTDELADPLSALERELHALGAALDETPAPERLEAAACHLRRLSTAVERARDAARLLDGEDGAVASTRGPRRARD